MQGKPLTVPLHLKLDSLRNIVLYGPEGVLENLPKYCANGLWPLPNLVVLEFFHAALALYSTGVPPALSPQQVFAALRRSDFPSFELVASEGGEEIPRSAQSVLASLGPDQVADMIASFLIARSEIVYLERISVSALHISSKRAFSLFIRLVVSAVKAGALTEVSVYGHASSSAPLKLSRDDLDAIAAAARDGNLRALVFPGLESVDDRSFPAFLEIAGVELERLNLAMTGVTNLSKILSNHFGFRRTLRVLDLSGTGIGAGADGLLPLLGLEALEELSIAWTPAVRPQGIEAGLIEEVALVLGSVVATSSMPCLTYLDMSGARLPLHHVLTGLDTLRSLILTSAEIEDLHDDRLFAESLPTKLEHLNLASCHGSASIGAILSSAARRTGDTLNRLCLCNCELSGWAPMASGDSGADVAAASEAIVHGEPYVDLRLALGPGLSAIRELDLSNVRQLTAAMICAVLTAAGLAARLEVLRLREVKVPALAECFSAVCELSDFPIVFSSLKHLNISESELSFANDGSAGTTGADLGWFIGHILSGGECSIFKAAGTTHMTYGVVNVVLDCLRNTLAELDISFLPFPQQHVLTGGHYAVMPPTTEIFPKLREVTARGCGELPQALVDILRAQAPLLETVFPIDEPVAKDQVGASLGLVARKQAFGHELVRRATEIERRELSELSWRVRQ